MVKAQPRHDPQPSWASTDGVARSMRSNRRRDTKPELAVRKILHAEGLRYRVDYAPGRDKRRRADIVFTRQKVAVFIDGCFWHGCPEHATIPKAHAEYWVPKLAKNKERDAETTAELQNEGWTVLRFWEHESPEAVAYEVADRIQSLRSVARDTQTTSGNDRHGGRSQPMNEIHINKRSLEHYLKNYSKELQADLDKVYRNYSGKDKKKIESELKKVLRNSGVDPDADTISNWAEHMAKGVQIKLK